MQNSFLRLQPSDGDDVGESVGDNVSELVGDEVEVIAVVIGTHDAKPLSPKKHVAGPQQPDRFPEQSPHSGMQLLRAPFGKNILVQEEPGES